MDETTKEINRLLAHEPCVVQHCILEGDHGGEHEYDPEDPEAVHGGTPDPEPPSINIRPEDVKEVEEQSRRLVEALRAGEYLRADRVRAELADALALLACELAPHGRHDRCGEPVNEDGECPTWCDQ